jgi:ATP-binding cassette, subfamily B, heavy metal transporter
VRIVSRGSTSFANVLRMMVFQLLPLALELIFVLIIIGFLYPWEFVSIVFASLVLYIALTYFVTEWRAKFFKNMTMKDAEYNQKATDSLLNFETVKYFNAEEHEANRFMLSLKQYMIANVAVAKSLVTLNIVQAICVALGLSTNLLVAFSKIQSGDLNVGDFVSLNAYILSMYIPLGFLGTFWRFIRQSMVDVELIFELLGVNEQTVNVTEQVGKRFEKGEIEFRNVSFSYDRPDVPEEERKMIIENLSFTVPAGKTVALVGSTGSGKSTIMRLLYRFYEISEGQILIDGEDITKMHINDLRQNIAIVPQDCVLFNDTIRYNIAYGGVNDEAMKALINDPSKEEALEESIIPAAKRAQIHGFVQEKHKKYNERVGERGLKLSGGEKQRVAIARALLKRTPIMCFDEATSALDTETEREIQKAIDEVSKGATSIIIAHRLSTVRNADIIIVLKHGVIVEQGSHNELLSVEHGHYKSLWEKQNEDDELQRQRERLRAAEEEERIAALRERAEARARASMKKSHRGGQPAIN